MQQQLYLNAFQKNHKCVPNVKRTLRNFETNLHKLKCVSICKETLIHKVSIHNAIQMFLYINVCNSTQIFESLMRGVQPKAKVQSYQHKSRCITQDSHKKLQQPNWKQGDIMARIKAKRNEYVVTPLHNMCQYLVSICNFV